MNVATIAAYAFGVADAELRLVAKNIISHQITKVYFLLKYSMFIEKSVSLILAADLISIHFKISFPNTFTLLDGFNHPNFF